MIPKGMAKAMLQDTPVNPLISVIIPAYNASTYIRKCLDSLVSQTLRKNQFEVIVVDDCSTDDTAGIVQEYCDLYNNFRMVRHSHNARQGAARNTGIINAKGEYLFFFDADDYIREDTLEILLFEQKKKNADLVFSDISVVDPFDHLIKTIDRRHNINSDRAEILSKSYYIWNILIRKTLLVQNDILFEEQIFHEDILFAYKIVFSAGCIASTGQSTYYYVVHEISTINSYSNLHVRGIVNAFMKVIQFLENRNDFTNNLVLLQSQFLQMMEVTSGRIIKYADDPQHYFQELTRQLLDSGMLDKMKVRNQTRVEQLFTLAGSKIFPAPFNPVSDFLNKNQINFSYDLSTEKKIITITIHHTDLSRQKGFVNELMGYLAKNNWFYTRMRRIQGDLILELQAKRQINQISLARYCFEKIVFVCSEESQLEIVRNITRETINQEIGQFVLDISCPIIRVEDWNKPNSAAPVIVDDICTLAFEPDKTGLLPLFGAAGVIFFTDNETTRPAIMALNRAGVPTIGISTGIHDDLNPGADVGKLLPNRTCRYLILPGEYYRSLYCDRKVYVGGIPGISSLMSKPSAQPAVPKVGIYCDFTDSQQAPLSKLFLKTSADACKLAGVGFTVICHPDDISDIKDYPSTSVSLEEEAGSCTLIVSRCTQKILEFLAMGKPVIYHNPHGKSCTTLKDPMGAFTVTHDTDGLKGAIDHLLEKVRTGVDFRKTAFEFLDVHANIGASQPAERIIASILGSILVENQSSLNMRIETLAVLGTENIFLEHEHAELVSVRKELEAVRGSKWWLMGKPLREASRWINKRIPGIRKRAHKTGPKGQGK